MLADFFIIVSVFNNPILIRREKENEHTNSGAKVHRASPRKLTVRHATNHPQEERDPGNANYEPCPPVSHILAAAL